MCWQKVWTMSTMEFKCLFCQDDLRDGDLVCKSSCEHLIHEWCIENMKNSNEHHCRICGKIIAVYSQFVEFDLSKAVTVKGMTTIVQKLDEIINLLTSREEKLAELTINHQDLADKVEGLLIEHHALKFEKNEMDTRLKKVEIESKSVDDQK